MRTISPLVAKPQHRHPNPGSSLRENAAYALSKLPSQGAFCFLLVFHTKEKAMLRIWQLTVILASLQSAPILAATYPFDPSHTFPLFEIDHLGFPPSVACSSAPTALLNTTPNNTPGAWKSPSTLDRLTRGTMSATPSSRDRAGSLSAATPPSRFVASASYLSRAGWWRLKAN